MIESAREIREIILATNHVDHGYGGHGSCSIEELLDNYRDAIRAEIFAEIKERQDNAAPPGWIYGWNPK